MKKNKSEPCESLPNLAVCKFPEIDIKHKRKLMKAFLAAFNKEFKKAIKDDVLVAKMEAIDSAEFPMFAKAKAEYKHSISFTSNQMLKLDI